MLIIGYSRASASPSAAVLAVENFTAYSDQSFNNMASLSIPPGVRAGNTLVAALRLGLSRIPGTPSGWTLVGSSTSDTGFYVYSKTAAGDEGGTTVNWPLNSSDNSAFVFAEIAGATGQVEVSFSSGSNDPPNHAPSTGGGNYVWIAVTTQRRNDNAVTGSPTGYSPLVTAESSTSNTTNGANITIGGAHRTAMAASEDPGAFAWTGTVHTGAQACTVSVR